ncbi:hypothetical protein COW36_12770 [bacterium (Candidatus Blackallbacteria) CG17_big_fil_post_rev_8_21_14_2_50_48_46]|uniref:Uncharacterized protein n=1 Tax=bacterium (Candidatus Blackallbacteria) CG17_big_fil_post_rev_8_21_14_2_50_48_46 TaxID=2014261 RepID=A0A2M7G522_9BACT|nr:MAG: hypothetical protein COW64_02495 [bacterium (Candidatus Blackallbacteria) CG18_big_fil_WC_8_21_14_2_50_49_26]PIW16634.1 MAG: hypothetical protein COW36_12770 [bacterium (Candidatus Blackallbacteria) CG17_big_fil_post_rev_8_21_14_2_50_48_46]PIW46141.1 MAG: hypothetical protein COW20_18030 [bacterium (Candidatus Blackallbacteria) CG13_big_fil_rev_8_21_14_2_50_49_14]
MSKQQKGSPLEAGGRWCRGEIPERQNTQEGQGLGASSNTRKAWNKPLKSRPAMAKGQEWQVPVTVADTQECKTLKA